MALLWYRDSPGNVLFTGSAGEKLVAIRLAQSRGSLVAGWDLLTWTSRSLWWQVSAPAWIAAEFLWLVKSSRPQTDNTVLSTLMCSGYQSCKKALAVLRGFPHKGYMVWVGRLCLSVYLERVKDFGEVRPCCAAGFLSENAFTLNSKERQDVCLRAKCVIHIIRVKFGISFHHLMPESELTLLSWNHNLLFFQPLLSPGRQRFLMLAAGRQWVRTEETPPELSRRPGVAVALQDGKSLSRLRRFAFGFISSSPNLSIFDCSRVGAGAGGEMDV